MEACGITTKKREVEILEVDPKFRYFHVNDTGEASRAKGVGAGNSLPSALERIRHHEDEMMGQGGSVSRVRYTAAEREAAANLCNARACIRVAAGSQRLFTVSHDWWLLGCGEDRITSQFFTNIVYGLADGAYYATTDRLNAWEEWLEAEAMIREGWLP